MSNYFYPQPQQQPKTTKILPQPSPMIALPVVTQDNRYVKEGAQGSGSSTGLGTIQRESSLNKFHDFYGGQVQQISSVHHKYTIKQHPKVISDYQLQVGVNRLSEPIAHEVVHSDNLPVGGGMNIASKFLQRHKNKSELHKSVSKVSVASQDEAKSLRLKEGVVRQKNQGEKTIGQQRDQIEKFNIQIARLMQRMGKYEQRIQKLEKKNEEAGSYNCSQLEEINKILNLVQKVDDTKNRDQYRKNMKMMEDLRNDILDCHSQLQNIKKQSNENNIQELRNSLQSIWKQQISGLNHRVEKESTQSIKLLTECFDRMKNLEAKLEVHYDDNRSGLVSSLKKFQGKMLTLVYQQRLIQQTGAGVGAMGVVNVGGGKGGRLPEIEKENHAVVTSKTYYLDNEGYLLDRNKYYLLNRKNEQIRLTEKELQILKKFNML